ncbi:RHS repeat protein, partial [Paenibacillus camerounensis]|uniref:RHS repeat protein n=1 Tax=Paenibacillus camerounensis TaxID=1243663 RepID=UPI001427DCFA
MELQGNPSKVTEIVYGKSNVVLSPEALTVTSEVYSVTDITYGRDSLGLKALQVDAVTTLDMNVARVVSDFKMEVVNQTAKPQFSDRSSSGEMIDPASGTLTWKDTQLSLPGRDGLDLNLGVTYSSSQAAVFDPMSGYYNYTATKFDLGTGWSFTLPSVQTYGSELYYHDGQGAIYQVIYDNSNTLLGYTHLKGYKGKDKRFMYDGSHTFTSNGYTASYYLEHANKTREYFGGPDNALLGIVDRFGNAITFKYGTTATANQLPKGVLSEITDSVGRKVKFEYDLVNNNYLPENTDSVEEKMTVTVVDSSGKEGQKVIYTRIRVGYEVHTVYSNGSFTRYWIGNPNPVLKSITYPNGEKVQFGYTKGFLNYNTDLKEFKPWDFNTYAQAYLRLNVVQYPQSRTQYDYVDVMRNFGPSGGIRNARISARYDQILKSGTFSGDYNRVSYSESRSYDAYPQYYMEDNYPDSFSYAGITEQTASAGKKVTITNTFNGKGQVLSTEQLSSNNERIVEKNTSFHSVFTQSPTTSERWEYGPGDSDAAANKLYAETSYDEWGNVSSATRLMTDSQRNNATLKGRSTTSFAYEPTYRFLSSKSWYANETQAAPYTESYTYTAQGRSQTLKNAVGETISYSYEMAPDGSNRLYKATATKSSGGKTVSKGVVTYGAETAYAYPTIEEAYSNIGLSNQQIVKKTTSYDMATARVSSVKEGTNPETKYAYDGLGRPTQISYPTFSNQDGQQYSVIEQFTYQPNQLSADYDSVNAGIHSLKVSASKTMTGISNGLKLTTSSEAFYDAFGQALLERQSDEYNGKWAVNQYHYDNLGRPVYSRDDAGNIVTAEYDAWGRQNQATDPNGNLLISNYSLKSRISTSYLQEKSTGNQLNYVEASYDPWGNKSSVATYKDWPSKYERIADTYSYDFAGNVVAYTDPAGNKNENSVTALYTYDGLGRLSAVKDALNQTTSYTYDGNNQLAKVTVQAKNGTPQTLNTKTYNELGLLTQKQDGASQNETYTYNNMGQLSSKTDRNGSAFTYAYDESGQLKTSKISGIVGGIAQTMETKINIGDQGPQYHSVQTLTNNVVTAKQTQKVDSLGRVRSTTSVVGGYSASIVNTYDTIGRLNKLQDNQATYTNYQYIKLQLKLVQTNGSDALNNAAAVNAQYSYYANNQVDTIIYPTLADGSALSTKHLYNKALGWTDSITNYKGSTVISKYEYKYDKNGNITSVLETLSAGAGGNGTVKTTGYGYDGLNRVTSISRPDGSSVTYTYDVRGNRLTSSDTAASSVTMTDTSYTYDLQNTLTSVTSGTSTTKFNYYADGLRYLKTNGTTSTRVNYNLNG